MPLIVLLGYFIGSIPFALVLARYRGLDLREIGSGNLGAANVLRASGATAGVVVAVLDIGKGALSVLLADQLSDGSALAAMAGLAAIVGHIYPIWLRFRGGKGVATACGVFAVLTPLAAAPAFAVFIATVWITRYISLGSVIASVVLPPVAYVTGSPPPVVASAVAASILIVFRHRSNLARLASGTERRIGARVAPAMGPDFDGPEA
jgi:acyl phosphate:glycerol-3-phosphate acyltransferase